MRYQFAVVGLVVAAAPAFAQTAGFQELGLMPYGLSSNGRFIAGVGLGANSNRAVVYNRPANATTVLGAGYASDVSRNGTAVTGRDGSGSVFRWTAAEGVTVLAPGSNYNWPRISADGETVVGNTSNNGAFRWTTAGGVHTLPGLSGMAQVQVLDVSADGSTSVGLGLVPNQRDLPIIWHGSTPSLPAFLSASNDYSLNAVSGDGRYAFGYDLGPHADTFRVDRCARGPLGLGFGPGGFGAAVPRASTGDGQTVVGGTFGNQAFIWTPARGPLLLMDVVTEDFGIDLGDMSLTMATGISDDGLVITGMGIHGSTSRVAGWVVTLPRPIPEPWAAGVVCGLMAWRRRRC